MVFNVIGARANAPVMIAMRTPWIMHWAIDWQLPAMLRKIHTMNHARHHPSIAILSSAWMAANSAASEPVVSAVVLAVVALFAGWVLGSALRHSLGLCTHQEAWWGHQWNSFLFTVFFCGLLGPGAVSFQACVWLLLLVQVPAEPEASELRFEPCFNCTIWAVRAMISCASLAGAFHKYNLFIVMYLFSAYTIRVSGDRSWPSL